jgi:UMF1 family MFS transporter
MSKIRELFKKDVLSWAMFDFANSSYSLLILSFVFPIYFKEIIAGNQYGDFYWGLIGSLSILLAGIASPVIGAIADYDSKKKSKFIFCVVLSFIATAILFFSHSNTLIFTSIIFMVSNLFFLLSQSLYDSFLSHVSKKENAGLVSGLGYSFGYLGGIVALILFKPFYIGGFAGENEILYRLVFPLTALFFILFSLPSFVYLKNAGNYLKPKKDSLRFFIKIGFSRTLESLRYLKKNKHLLWFLIAFYLLTDGLVTIFAFISIYGIQTIKLTMPQIMVVFIIVQIIAIPSSLFFGWLADKKGQKKILLWNIFGWILITFFLSIGKSAFIMYLIAILTGLFIGGSQSIARSWFSNLIPEEKRFSLFGFNSFASKISAVIGPLLYGAISVLSGNQRIAMLSLIPFFVISFIIFLKIKHTTPPQ